MSRRSRRNRGRQIAKASTFTPPTGSTLVPTNTLLGLIGQSLANVAEPLPRPADWATLPFAPGLPLVPQPINPVLDSGRAMPRRYEYPVSSNLPGVDQRVLPWKVLRDAADKVDLIRQCIEVRKAEVQGLGWEVTVSEDAVEAARLDDPSATDAEIGDKLRDESSEEIARIRAFWMEPDRGNGFSFDDWIGQVIEEHLVLDAIAIYPRMTRGGDLYSFEVLDGTTIKPLLDDRGNTPLPPNPAYQQILQGFPRGEFVADGAPDPDDPDAVVIPNAYRTDQLVYARRCVRTFTPYGYSPVEQALVSADLWLKRQEWLRAEYTDGVMPSGWITTDSPMTPQQLRDYRAVLNDELAGLTRERQRFQVLPKGFKPEQTKDVGERYKKDFDEFLLKLVCGHLGVLPSQLGITPGEGLGGQGHQEGEEDSEERLSTRPTTQWLAALITKISRQYLGMSSDLTFKFLGLDAEDEAVADTVGENRMRSGRATLNEERDRLGLHRFDFPEADTPMIVDRTGVIFLDGEKARTEQDREIPYGVGPAPTPNPNDASLGVAAQVPSGSSTPPAKAPAASASTPKPQNGSQSAAQQKAEELVALRRFAKRGGRRAFTARHLTPEDVEAAGLTKVDVVYAKADDASREEVDRVGLPRGHHRPVVTTYRRGFVWGLRPPRDQG